MWELTKDGFEKQKLHGIYIFKSVGCDTCNHHIERFQKFTKDFFIVPTNEDPNFFEEVVGIRLTPTTRVYKHGELKWSKEGALYDTQIEDLRNNL